MACRLEKVCQKRNVCEIVEAIQGNPCNPYILKKDTPADYLPGDKPAVENLRFLFSFNPPGVFTCAAGQTITIKE